MASKKKIKIKWFFLDFGSLTNNWTKKIDFKFKSIELKDAYQYITLNYNIITDINYDCCIKQINTFNNNNTLLQEDIEKFYYNNFGELILKDIYDKVCNEPNIDISYIDFNNILITTIPICAFDTINYKYICIVNFNSTLSKCLKILTSDEYVKKHTAMHIITVNKGIINNYSYNEKHNGYQFNVLLAFWKYLETRLDLLDKKYYIDKLSFTLGNLICAIIPNFTKLYIIFDAIGSGIDKLKYNFKRDFIGIKDKTKRAKKLNNIKNKFNILLKDNTIKDLKDSDEFNFVDLNKSLSQLSINNTKQKNNTCKYMNHNSSYNSCSSNSSKERDTQIHTICKYLTGSKHCYYSGYQDIIKDIDKFTSSQSKFSLNLDYNDYDILDDINIITDGIENNLIL